VCKIGLNFCTGISADPDNSTRKMFYFDQPDLGLSREFLVKGLQAKEVQVKLNIEHLIYRNMNINMSYSSKIVMFVTAIEQFHPQIYLQYIFESI
jgi:hypothetical protein